MKRSTRIRIVVALCTWIVFGFCTKLGNEYQPFFQHYSLENVNNVNVSAAATDNEQAFIEWSSNEHNIRQMLLERSRSIIPVWMEQYVMWHQEQRRKFLTNTSLHDTKFMVVGCMENQKCGGLSDRMKPLPFYLMLANMTQRVLLFHWTKPCPLEQFLVPPDENGINWMIEGTPVTLQEIRNQTNYVNGHASSLSYEVRMLAGLVDGGDRSYLSTCKVLNVNLDGGQQIKEAVSLFNRWRKEPGQSPPSWAPDSSYLGWNPAAHIPQREMLEDVYRLLFQPSPGVERAIFDQMNYLGIQGQNFIAVQVRAKHPKFIPIGIMDSRWKLDMLENVTYDNPKFNAYLEHTFDNAIGCVQNISNEIELPIYLASDSKFGNLYYKNSSLSIRVPTYTKGDPLHIDSNRFQGRDPKDFYQVFIDNFIMQKATCLSHSGGFGVLALRLNNNLTECEVEHTSHECPINWKQREMQKDRSKI
ncbi:hypothetical protein ACHAWT_010660 [Skeletonema menzelii]